MKNIGVVSHVNAQRENLLRLVEQSGLQGVSHAIVTRIADDTNIWVEATRNAKQDQQKGKSGGKKVTSVLGLCEGLTLRSTSGLCTVELTAPAQVLEKVRPCRKPVTDFTQEGRTVGPRYMAMVLFRIVVELIGCPDLIEGTLFPAQNPCRRMPTLSEIALVIGASLAALDPRSTWVASSCRMPFRNFHGRWSSTVSCHVRLVAVF